MTTTTAVDSKWKFCPILCTKHYISWRFLLKKLSGYKNTSGVNCISSKKMILHRSVVFVVVVIVQKKKSLSLYFAHRHWGTSSAQWPKIHKKVQFGNSYCLHQLQRQESIFIDIFFSKELIIQILWLIVFCF